MNEAVNTYARCPQCDATITEYEEMSHDFDDRYVFVNWRGWCPTCQRPFSFSETFALVERRFVDEED